MLQTEEKMGLRDPDRLLNILDKALSEDLQCRRLCFDIFLSTADMKNMFDGEHYGSLTLIERQIIMTWVAREICIKHNHDFLWYDAGKDIVNYFIEQNKFINIEKLEKLLWEESAVRRFVELYMNGQPLEQIYNEQKLQETSKVLFHKFLGRKTPIRDVFSFECAYLASHAYQGHIKFQGLQEANTNIIYALNMSRQATRNFQDPVEVLLADLAYSSYPLFSSEQKQNIVITKEKLDDFTLSVKIGYSEQTDYLLSNIEDNLSIENNGLHFIIDTRGPQTQQALTSLRHWQKHSEIHNQKIYTQYINNIRNQMQQAYETYLTGSKSKTEIITEIIMMNTGHKPNKSLLTVDSFLEILQES
jgi:hypothetical protein